MSSVFYDLTPGDKLRFFFVRIPRQMLILNPHSVYVTMGKIKLPVSGNFPETAAGRRLRLICQNYYKGIEELMENKQYDTPFAVDTPDVIRKDLLEPIEYAYKSKRSIDIKITQPEYTSVCPMTGLPDNGTIIIEYRPDAHLVELKSLKYYLMQYRNVGMFYEHVVNKILDDLVEVLKPLSMKVTGEFTPRGGISSVGTAEYVKV